MKMEGVELLQFELKLFVAGRRLELPPSSKDELLQALEQVEAYLRLVEQKPPQSILEAMFPSIHALRMPFYLRHSDNEVTLLVISCQTQILRITAPDEQYCNALMKVILELTVGSFQELGDMNNPSFERRFSILQTFGQLHLCTFMLDLELDDLLLDMFKHFFSAVSQNPYSADVYGSMKMIMCKVLDESDDISEELLSVLLINLRREMQDSSPAAHSLSLSVVASCAEKLRPYLRAKMSSNQAIICSCRHGYEEIVYDICRHGSQGIDVKLYKTACPEPILITGSSNTETCSSSVDNLSSQVASSQLYPDHYLDELIRVEKKNDELIRVEKKNDELIRVEKKNGQKKRKEAEDKLVSSGGRRQGRPTKRSCVREDPMRIAHSADTGHSGGESNNNISVSKYLNRNRPPRKSARKKSISAMERTVEVSGEDEKLIGRKVKVWWPSDKEFYEGIVESYDPNSKRHAILYFDGEREELQLWRERWDFIDHIPRLIYK